MEYSKIDSDFPMLNTWSHHLGEKQIVEIIDPLWWKMHEVSQGPSPRLETKLLF